MELCCTLSVCRPLESEGLYLLRDQARLAKCALAGPSATLKNDARAASGLVSRVAPVQTAMRNCTTDEGRSFEFGNQVSISSHRKLLSSKAMAVNVAEKSEQDFDRYD
jgi:hypothetical protein